MWIERIWVALLVLLCITALSGCGPSDTIRVGTYNIRYSPGDVQTCNAWMERRDDLIKLVRDLKLDVFGMQEVCPDQAQYLRENLPEFVFIGEHREADRKSGEASPVFYRKSRFEVLKGGTFWLSETPEVPASKSWGTSCTRVCSYLVLRDRRTGGRFCFANTHTDNVSELARENGMRLILERMRNFGHGVSIVLVGDHNNTEIEKPAENVAKILRNALYQTETPPRGPWRTWNGWQWMDREVMTAEALSLPINVRNIPNNEIDNALLAVDEGTADAAQRFYGRCSGPRIDYIWVSDDIRVLNYATVDRPRPELKLYPSDHFPIVATFELPRSFCLP